MLRNQLKSKIHMARVSDANLNYEGSITIPADLMKEVDLWPGEKVLIVCKDSGARLETYVQPGPACSKAFIINGPAARRVGTGDCITIMAFGQSEKPIEAQKLVCDATNTVVRREKGVGPVEVPSHIWSAPSELS
jgi:aspartate 1-decarboxylase